MLASPESARVIDRTLAGPLPEEVARSIVRHRVLERMVAELADSGELDRLMASDEVQRALGQVMASPAVRQALTKQTTGFAEEVAGSLRGSARRLDGGIEHAVRRRARAEPTVNAGVATRAVALAVDVFLATAIYTLGAGIVAIISSLVGGLRPHWLAGALLAVGWVLIAGGYFVLFWSSTGQTPGMRLLHLRVHAARGVPSMARSIVRLGGLVLSILILFLGFVPVLFDKRRRGLADFLAGTTVDYD